MNLFELNTILYLIYLIGNLNLRIVLNDLNEFDTDIRLILYVVFIVLSFSIFLDCMGMSTSAATLLLLRKKKQGDASVTGILKKWTPILCVIFVLSYFMVAIAVVIDKPYSALTALILLALVLGIYRVFYHQKKAF